MFMQGACLVHKIDEWYKIIELPHALGGIGQGAQATQKLGELRANSELPVCNSLYLQDGREPVCID